MSRRRNLLTVALLTTALATSPWAAAQSTLASQATGAGQGDDGPVELLFLNGDYANLDTDIAPIRQGPLVIQVSSPEHRMTVHGNRLVMIPGPEGVAEAAITVDLEGYGELIADLQSLGATNRFEDRVQVPRQSLSVAGKIRLRRQEEGFELIVVELPEAVRLQIESGVASQIVGLCEGLDKLPLISLGCDGLAQSLAVVSLPLPKEGEAFFIEDQRLTPADRAYLLRFSESLAATAPQTSAAAAE